MTRLYDKYKDSVVKELMNKFNYSSAMQVPRITKITLNMGVGEAVNDKKLLSKSVDELELIAGQKPLVTKARKSIAGFKIRQGWPIGCKVTLRRNKMYEFLDRLISIYLPRVRDFRGLNPKAMDGMGNYNMGFKEQIVCPEIDYDKIDKIRGLNISISTTAKNNEEAIALFKLFNFPLKG